MAEPLRLYRWNDAPPELQALSDAGGDEVLLAVVPAAWLVAWNDVLGLPPALWVLLEGDARFVLEQAWGKVQRVPLADESLVVIVSRP